MAFEYLNDREMAAKPLNIRQSLNKGFLRAKPKRTEIELFKENYRNLIEQINIEESEEFHKNIISDFLKNTYYSPKYFINTKGKNDLVIHNGKDGESPVGVLIEVKNPSNKTEMITKSNLNKKALHELVLYYLRERITDNNLEIKYLIVTNVYEWFIFDANIFEKYIYGNSTLCKSYKDFEKKRLSGKNTEFFYKEIAAPHLENIINEIEYTFLDIRKYKSIVQNNDRNEDHNLIEIFKIFSESHLLKLPFTNDNNVLNREFYNELLQIIGLSEKKTSGNKRIIVRRKLNERSPGSLIENCISQIESLDKVNELDNPGKFGIDDADIIFNASLALSITWITRIIFLKLLESQLLSYNSFDSNYSFMNKSKLKDYDDLNYLFFSVLAKNINDRTDHDSDKFKNIPYLNSSLFEPTDLEHATIFISNLRNERKIQIYSKTVLKDSGGKKMGGEIEALEYLFKFLNAYDFSSEGSEAIQEENKSLISASVLGLIFEKINGYKDGSFFTPGYITMHMCREAITKCVIDKFNQERKWECKNFNDLYNNISNKKEANEIINSIKICDPAVGSGHFLISALNEIISIKSQLNILLDKEGKTLRDYNIEVVNDELIITDEDGKFFVYKKNSKECQRVQETIFHEKENIIENCLFGVDININSVKICRLRLWIELLKNAYYKNVNGMRMLETLPNIDINNKHGNALISRYSIDMSLENIFANRKLTPDRYKEIVRKYKLSNVKNEKKEMEIMIKNIKSSFHEEILENYPVKRKYNKCKNELKYFIDQNDLFEENTERIKKLKKDVKILGKEMELIKNSRLFQDAFEWLFEFPEILDDKGNFSGFDLVISNPPYGVNIRDVFREKVTNSLGKVPDYEIYYYFINLARKILKEKGILSFIVPNTLLLNVFAKTYRENMLNIWSICDVIDCTDFKIFVDASVKNVILLLKKDNNNNDKVFYRSTSNKSSIDKLINSDQECVSKATLLDNNDNWALVFKLPPSVLALVAKIKLTSNPMNRYFSEISQGLIAYDKYTGQDEKTISERRFHSNNKKNKNYKPWLSGSDITRYKVKWNGEEYINYCDGIANPRKPKYFKGKRILVIEITNPSIFAGLSNTQQYNDPAIINILDSKNTNISIYTLLGILNSKLATYYHFNASPKATKGAFPKILVKDIKNFPISSNLDKRINKIIHDMVVEIIKLRKNEEYERSEIMEKKIDYIIYDLYELSKTEKRLIENIH